MIIILTVMGALMSESLRISRRVEQQAEAFCAEEESRQENTDPVTLLRVCGFMKNLLEDRETAESGSRTETDQ